ncbi:Oidioi.mRNA.OKI2018_I69.PAR.g10162.t1.cds [Oikopleura dioica]|uniref:Oidioi.mRNA.OKI2018_I69.PAR.g10162.t1.cds n=1 Tax=Oikopleura dioica TaxID=34765 RepID=A0ABN7RSN9_OIKDI|nr:Oidioi.mRNA.OKI2018_I69.PAR.g10162.t1.cds [Oikopleura dioica]
MKPLILASFIISADWVTAEYDTTTTTYWKPWTTTTATTTTRWPLWTTTYGTNSWDPYFLNCGGWITSPQTLTSPNFPANYPGKARCSWTIRDRKTDEYRNTIHCGSNSNWTFQAEVSRIEMNDEEEQERVLTWGRVPVVGLPTLHGYTSLKLWTDGYKEFAGFKLEIVPAYPKYYLDKIDEKIQNITNSLPKNKFGRNTAFYRRFNAKMTRVLGKFDSSNFEDLCYEENGFESRQEIHTDFGTENLCNANLQLNDAINNFAANFACDGRGKLFRKMTRHARRTKEYFIKNFC